MTSHQATASAELPAKNKRATKAAISVTPSQLYDSKLTFSVLETAHILDRGINEIYALLNSGKLKARKHGRKTVILRQDLDAYLQSLPKYGPDTKATVGRKNINQN